MTAPMTACMVKVDREVWADKLAVYRVFQTERQSHGHDVMLSWLSRPVDELPFPMIVGEVHYLPGDHRDYFVHERILEAV